MQELKKVPEYITITAHTGALNMPENSIECVEKCLEFGAKIIEIDVSFTPSGKVVIIHKDEPEENEGVEIEKVLELVSKKSEVQINLDIKNTSNLTALEILCEKYGLMDRVFYTGIHDGFIQDVKGKSRINYYLNHNVNVFEAKSEKLLQQLANKIKSSGAVGLNTRHDFCNELVTSVMHKNGLLVSLWTANSVQEANRCIKAQPDNITSKNMFAELMEKK